jgi:transposase, IS30 family
MQKRRYKRLTNTERESISRGLAQNKSIREIAKRIMRYPSTVAREISRNRGKSSYRAFSASQRAKRAAASRKIGKSKLAQQDRLRRYVIHKLKEEWSPKEISERIRIEYPKDTGMAISHEAIYQYIYVLPRGELKKMLIKALRQEHKYRRVQKEGKAEENRGKIANMISIEERPAEVVDRTVPGHWEGDLILGKYKRSALGSLVERTTRYTILVPIRDQKDALSVREAYTQAFKAIPEQLRKTMTYDQGKEMSQHEQLTIDTGLQVFFAHPGSPWERGTNENTNGLIRQYFPKGTDFNQVTFDEIKEVERRLNNRPRKVLNYYKPDEVFLKLVALND